jgi:benzoate-CoA ligase
MARVDQKTVICASCDIACSLIAHVRDGRVIRVRASNYGLACGMNFPLFEGATTVLMKDRATPENVTRVLSAHNPSLFFAVPTIYAQVLTAVSEVADLLQSNRLRLCMAAGERLPVEVERRYGVQLLEALGNTELLRFFVSNQGRR